MSSNVEFILRRILSITSLRMELEFFILKLFVKISKLAVISKVSDPRVNLLLARIKISIFQWK